MCFTSILILRLIQKIILKDELSADQIEAIEKANKKKRVHKIRIEKVGELPMSQIVSFMRNFNAQLINDSYYVGYYDKNIHLFEDKYNLLLDKHRHTVNDVEKIFNKLIYNTR